MPPEAAPEAVSRRMEILLVAVVVALAIAVVAAPLRAGRTSAVEAGESAVRAELEAAKESKLREIREAELDRRLDKLSPEDWKALDAELRGEAIELMRELDGLDDDRRG